MANAQGGPFAHPAFSLLWTAGLVANTAIWMQTVGAASLMSSLTPSPMMVALVQAATSLPTFLFGLPGGVLADRVDRRRWLMFTQGWMLATSALLCAASLLGHLGPWVLLALTFLLASGNALNTPAWQSATAEAVPRNVLPGAVAANSAAYSVARVVGPALAGLLAAALGPTFVFMANALCFGLAFLAMARWQSARIPRTMPPESLMAGMRSGLRYAWHAPMVRWTLWRTALMLGSGSSLWALLPVLARDTLQLGPSGLGLLLGALGAGAVGAAVLLPKLRERASVATLVHASALAFAATCAAIALARNTALVSALLVVAGAAWVLGVSNCTAVLQTSVPGWVRSRAAAIYVLTAHGAMGFGSIVWGLTASHLDVQWALWLSALVGMLGALATRRQRLQLGSDQALATVPVADDSRHAIDPAAGPVAVEVLYQVPRENLTAFAEAVRRVGSARRRNGASAWRLDRVLGCADTFVERFALASWLDYQRFRQRDTHADRDEKKRVAELLVAGTVPQVRRTISLGERSADEHMNPPAL